ncbi:MAG: 50S ribosomal protein L3 [Myxococcota bacterium]|jgi:large subunit ribosomal protein L3
MAKGLFGRKLGMTQVFDLNGNRLGVTVLEVGPCPIVRIKSAAGPDGYNAILIAYGKAKQSRVTKPKAGLFKKAGLVPLAHLREMRVEADDVASVEVGMVLDASVFSAGQIVDVVGTTKGRGFTGVIKRHNFHQPKASHGTHEVFRHGGSLGSNTTPGRVVLGRKMAGQYGNERVTIQNLTIASVEADRNLVVIRGSVPGANGSIVWIQESAKVKPAAGPAN